MISLGPFALSIYVAVGALSLLAWLLLAQYYDKRYNLGLESHLWWMLLSGLVAGRLAFVLLYWEQYRHSFWSVFNVRDGGFSLRTALLVLVALIAIQAYRSAQQRPYWWRLTGGGLLLSSVLLAAALWFSPRPQIINTEYLSLVDLAGQPVALERYQDKPMVLNLWASWCGPCRAEMPVLEQAQQQYPQFHFVFVNQGESRARIAHFLQEENLNLSHVLSDVDSTVLLALQSRALPTTLFLDAQGQIVATRIGELSEASLHSFLQRL